MKGVSVSDTLINNVYVLTILTRQPRFCQRHNVLVLRTMGGVRNYAYYGYDHLYVHVLAIINNTVIISSSNTINSYD